MMVENDKPQKSRARTSKTERKLKASPGTIKTVKSRKRRKIPVVGIGASAGGFEALQELLKNIPLESGMAFLVVQHLDPSHTSILPGLLTRTTSIPIHLAKQGMKVKNNYIYVIPPNKNMAIMNGILQLSDITPEQGLRLPVDYLFRW